MSQPTLIASEFFVSLAPPSLTLACQWAVGDKTVYSAMLCTAENLCDIKFWNDQETAMAQWLRDHKCKHGEIACIRM